MKRIGMINIKDWSDSLKVVTAVRLTERCWL